MPILTLSARKHAAAAARRLAVSAVLPGLTETARALGGRFLVFGSAARGTLRGDSDLDLLLDFPTDEATTAAWDFAERHCAAHGVPNDTRPVAWCDEAFLRHVLPTAVVLG